MRPAPPGQRVASGHLRVDADKAIAKLRQYQLADRTEWVLEAIRGAVCLGATSISLRGDANDVWLDWAGPTIAKEHLPDLLDELVSPGTAQNRGRRLIASGLNSALGLKPSFVDVSSITRITSTDEQGAWSARYVPAVLDGGDSSQAAAELRAIERPAVVESVGGRIHFRRPLRTEVLHYLFVGPPEIRLAKDRCRELPIPITINGVSIEPRKAQIRVPIELGQSAFIELGDPAPDQAAGAVLIELAELGVVLQRYSLAFKQLKSTTPLPIRLLVNANRLHTNASRSEVRQDVYPVATLTKELPRYVESLLAALCGALGDGIGTIDEHDPNRWHALELIATRTRHKSLAEAKKSSILKESGLLEVPLVFDACGTPRPVAHRWGFDSYRGRKAYPAELSPWLGDVLWLKDDDPAALLFGNAQPSGRSGRKRAKRARAQLAARRRFLAGPRRPMVLDRLGLDLVRSPIGAHVENSCVSEILQAAKRDGIRGELALTSGPTSFELCHLERHIATAPPPKGLSVAAIIDSPVLRPLDDYRGLHFDDALTQVIDVASAQAVASVEALVNRELNLGGTTDFSIFLVEIGESELAKLVRAALLVAEKLSISSEPSKLVIVADLVAQAFPSSSEPGQEARERRPLHRAPAFVLASGGFASLEELRSHSVIGTTLVKLKRPSPFGQRPIVIASPLQKAYLIRALAGTTRVVFYNPSHFRKSDVVGRAINAAGVQREDVIGLECSSGQVRGAIVIGPGVPSMLALAHGGQVFRRRVRKSRLTQSFIWAEVDDAVPDWDSADRSLVGSARNFSFKAWEKRVIVELGRQVQTSKVAIESMLGKLFFEAIGKLRKVEEELGEELYEALRAARLFRSIDGSQVSVASLEQAFPKSIYVLLSVPKVVVPDWAPAVCSPLEKAALKALSARQVRDGKAQYVKRVSRHQADLAKERRVTWFASILMEPPFDKTLGGTTVVCGSKRLGATIGLGSASESIRAYLTIEGRLFKTITIRSRYGLEAIVRIDPKVVQAPYTGIPPDDLTQISSLCELAIGRLLCKVAAADPAQITSPGPLRQLAARWLTEGPTIALQPAVAALRKQPVFQSLRGKPVSIADASPREEGSGKSVSGVVNKLFSDLKSILRPGQDSGEEPSTEEKSVSPGQVSIARFYDDWLEPTSGKEKARTFSRSIIRYHDTEPEFVAIFDALAPDKLDLTDRVQTVQLQRRVERGLLGVPSVGGAESHKRKLHKLDGSVGVVGEIGLAETETSVVQLFRRGQPLSSETLELSIPVVAHVEIGDGAVDGWQGEALATKLAKLTGALLDEIVGEHGIDSLGKNLRASLVRSILNGKFPSNGSENWELFVTTRGRRVTLSELVDQQSMHGDIWYVTEPTELHPLKRTRFALVLSASDVDVDVWDFKLRKADAHLANDAIARVNLARPRVRKLVLSDAQVESALLVREQTRKNYKGIIAPLRPETAALRGLSVYHNGIYLGDFEDPCQWPTASVIESGWLNPNQTLDAPIDDARWREILRAVRMSADAAGILARSDEPLVSQKTHTSHNMGGRKVRFRGLLWLDRDPAFSGVHLPIGGRRVLYSPSIEVGGVSVPLPIVGELVGYPQVDEMPTAFLAAVTKRVYGVLTTELLKEAWKEKNDLIESKDAHLAYALAIGKLSPSRCVGISFPVLGVDNPAEALASFLKQGNRQLADSVDSDTLTSRALTMLRSKFEAATADLEAAAAKLKPALPVHAAIESVNPEPIHPASPTPTAPSAPKVVTPAERARLVLVQALRMALARRSDGRAVVGIEIATSKRAALASVKGSIVEIGYRADIQRLAELLAESSQKSHWLIDQLALHVFALLRDANLATASEEKVALERPARNGDNESTNR